MSSQQQPAKLEPAELDHILLERDALLPSSGFAASVMDVIRHEASVPAPIPFPWKRVLPAFFALLAGLLIFGRLWGRLAVIAIAKMGRHPAVGTDWLSWLQSSAAMAVLLRTQIAPAVLAIAASLACIALCSKFTSGWSAK